MDEPANIRCAQHGAAICHHRFKTEPHCVLGHKTDDPCRFPLTNRYVLKDCDDETLVELREHFRQLQPTLRHTGSRIAEREIRIKLGAVEYVMRERGLID